MNWVPNWRVVCISLIMLYAPQIGHAQTCGDIIYYDTVDNQEYRDPITNCDNPLNLVDGERFSDVSFTYEGQPIDTGSTISLETIPTQLNLQAVVIEDTFGTNSGFELYRHEGDDFRKFDVYGEVGINATGTYTLVHSIEELPILSHNTLDRVFGWLLPKAYAQGFIFGVLERTALTFTVELVEPEPAGASSVLFLPGIQASRLYKERSLVGEDQLWEPSVTFGNDFVDLAMTESGESIEDVYTKPGDAIGRTRYIGGNLVAYETFLAELAVQKTEEAIADYEVLAYDWRYDVQDIVKDGIITGEPGEQTTIFPIDALIALIEKTPSGRISIVAHSNGGLLAKAMLQEIEDQCNGGLDPCPLNNIDQLILLGSPQTGTPQAFNQLLHGPPITDLLAAFVLQPVQFRSVSKNLPGAYGLLPNEDYFSGLNAPLITFNSTGGYLDSWVDAYPDGVDSPEILRQFLLAEQGRGVVGPGQLSLPLILNETVLNQGMSTSESLSDWQAPDALQVIEIVGVGELTTAGLRYETVMERPCIICPVLPLTKPIPTMSLYGDQTVMARSASGYGGEKETYYVDLKQYNLLASNEDDDDIFPSTHANLSEPADVQTLIFALVSSSTLTDSAYISTTLPEYEGESFDGLSTHSPVDILAEDIDGNQTGLVVDESGNHIIVEDIPGSRFFQIGSSSYLYVPSDTEYQVFIEGNDEGSFSLIIDDIVEGETANTRFRVEDATTTASTTALFQKDGDVFTDLMIDVDGDGIAEMSVPIDDSVVDKKELYEQLRNQVASSSSLSDRRKLVLITAINQTEQLGQLSNQYRFIGKLERKLLQQHITKLKRWRDRDRLSKSEFRILRATIKDIIKLTRS